MRIGVIQNQTVRITITTCGGVSQINLQRRHDPPDAYRQQTQQQHINRQYQQGRARASATRFLPPPIISTSAIRWLTSDERKTESGTISAGNTVFVMRFAWSSSEDDERCRVSLNNSQGSMPANKNSG